MNVEGGFQASDLLAVVRRRGKVVIGAALTVFLAVYWVAMALPNEFESYATILVEPQSVSPDLVQAGVGRSDINQRLGLMTAQILSRPRLSRLIDELGLYEVESKTMVRQKVIDLMRKAVRVEPVVGELEQGGGPRSKDAEINTFRLYFRHENPKVARDVAQELANDFIEQHIDRASVDLSQKSLEFIQTELTAARRAHRRGRGQRLQRQGGESGPAARRHAGESAAPRSTDGRPVLRPARPGRGAQRRGLLSQPGGGCPGHHRRTFGRRPSSPERKLRVLELLLADLSARGFTEKHPDVAKVMTEIETLKSRMAAVKAGDVEESPSYAVQSAEAESRAGCPASAGLRRSEIERLTQQADSLQQLMAETPECCRTARRPGAGVPATSSAATRTSAIACSRQPCRRSSSAASSASSSG